MKIGDKVRFLLEKGGGKVAGFQGKDIVLVEDEDGFEIPMPVKQCVVVDTNEYNIAKVHTLDEDKKPKIAEPEETDEVDIDKPITYKRRVEERKDGNKVNVFLAYVPKDIKMLTNTTFDAYIVNDCNYYIFYTYLCGEGNSWRLHSQGVLEPNSKIQMEEFGLAQLNEMSQVAVQFVAYKEDRSFMLKPAATVQVRINLQNFYKMHTFEESMFFTEPALIYDIVKDDVIQKTVYANADDIKEALLTKKTTETDNGYKIKHEKKEDKNAPLEVDLHIDSLLDNTANMTNGEILEYQLKVFRETMDKHLKQKGKKIVFIHGKGEGVLRRAVEKELKHKYKGCTFQDASFQQYGFGATMVTI
ncbi:Smr domain-containing protein [Bacteroidales bacterium KHT7]|jgi:hypothetical protein|nr:DUF2027 domain-containing protein [Bacteroidaceae bacterium]MBQ1677068.1 DUF2027 domain-containing protein [Bacteroidaceae bacterium]MBQ3874317.1 DUF2027 domain-containing protein [Bacteroidaceae bacterium]SDG62623.1 Smr domain-containing protein [Bacteroidales bacterium KHT7]